MKTFLSIFFVFFLPAFSANAQLNNKYFGIWQAFTEPLSISQFPEIRGRLSNFYWKDLEISPGVWDWTAFDSDLARRTQDGLPVIFMVYVRGPQGDAPGWLFNNGVPKVIIKDSKGNIIGSSPYYADSIYKSYFKKMIIAVHQHVETLPSFVRSKIIGAQACFGSTGDFISYEGGIVSPQFALTPKQFSNLFREFTQYYFDEYKNTNPKIALLSNPKSQGKEDALWVASNCPRGWLKNSTLAKAFQLNDELDKSLWLYDLVNKSQSDDYIRMRCEISGGSTSSGWWKKFPYKNMFAVMCYDIYWGLDWPNQDNDGITDPLFDSAFNFFNKYAGQKDPAKSTNAMCALKDALDASDSVRFPSSVYGTASRTNTRRYENIANEFLTFGAKLEDVKILGSSEIDQLSAAGTNDVGWRLLPGNYERYLHQIRPNESSVGYWNVESADPNSMFGRFARGFEMANNKDALYFDVDSSFLSNAPLNASYPITIVITYLDKGNGSWQLFYDAQTENNKPSVTINCANSGFWKTASVTLDDAYFGNRSINGSDFYIKSTNTENVIFSVVELARENFDLPKNNLSSASLLNFDTLCANHTRVVQAFSLADLSLSNSNITIGPLPGYKFSGTVDGAFSDSLMINYDASFSTSVYVEFSPTAPGSYNGNIPITANDVIVNVPVIGVSLDTSTLSARVIDISCNNANNGAIELTTAGAAALSFNWTSAGTFRNSSEDISGLSPGNYTVTVTSINGCRSNATYNVTQPNALNINLSADNMICKGGTTVVHAAASGGTTPYFGTGNFTVSSGTKTFTVTDGNGCSTTKSINIPNGSRKIPNKPGSIMSASDATGLCGGSNFDFVITPVSNATSYSWTVPPNISIIKTSSDGSLISLKPLVGFSGGTLSVTANNVCGSSVAQTKVLNAVPNKPGAISGFSSVSNSQAGVVYSVPSVNGLIYTWHVPAGAKIVSGQNTPSITVNWSTTSGKITVKAVNACGTSSASNLNVTVSSMFASQAVVAALSRKLDKSVTVSPNPVSDIAYITFETNNPSNYTLELRDLAGKLLFKSDVITSAGKTKVGLDMHSYASGMYLILLYDNTRETTTIRLMKQVL